MNLLERRRTMLLSTTKPIVPYQEIMYLQGDGASYIDLGFAPSFMYLNDWQLDFEVLNTNVSVFGGITGGYQFVYIDGRFRADWVQGSTALYKTKLLTLNTKYSLVQSSNVLMLDDASWNITVALPPSAPQMYLFTRNQVEASTIFTGRIYKLTVTSGTDNILFNAIPVRIGNVGYLYETVSQQLLENKGTGNFILGPDVN